MTTLYYFCSNRKHVSTESQTYSDAAGPNSVKSSTAPVQTAVSRQSSTTSRKSSSAKSDTTSASKSSVSRKFAPSTYPHIFQQRSLKASINVLVYLIHNCLRPIENFLYKIIELKIFYIKVI